MTNLEPELQALRENLLEMMSLASEQLMKARKALAKADRKLAKEVVETEKRMNQFDLFIDRDCENILALYNPVATDLRFVLSALNISNALERIGDNAKILALIMLVDIRKENLPLIARFNLDKMLDVSIKMLNATRKALVSDDTKAAKKVFKKDAKLDDSNRESLVVAEKLLKSKPKDTGLILLLFSMAGRLERVGDLIKNISEEIVFYLDAKVLKHKGAR